MEIVVTGRHIQVTDRFREHLEDKLAKVTQLAPRVRRVDVVVTHERTSSNSERVEITCRATGSIVRSEACADDKFAAADLALDKLMERLRRSNDKRRVARQGRRVPSSVHDATGRVAANGVSADEPSADSAAPGDDDQQFGVLGDGPIQVREKVHVSRPMTLEDALGHMEALGHDFFLFHDVESERPSVVYRRRGWSYGVIHLDLHDGEEFEQITAVG